MKEYIYIKQDRITGEYIISPDDTFQNLIYCENMNELIEKAKALLEE